MTMGMAIKVSAMALGTSTARATIDRGIATTVHSHPAITVNWIMTRGTRGMDCRNCIAGMAADAERGGCHRSRMAVDVTIEIKGVAASAGSAPEDGGNLWPINRIFESRRRGVAVGTTVVMNPHRIIGRMTDRHASRRIKNDTRSRT